MSNNEAVIKLLQQDLETYSQDKLEALAKHLCTENNVRSIAEKVFMTYSYANMLEGPQLTTNDMSKYINFLNDDAERNISLRTGLIITNYTDKPLVNFFETLHLDIKQQPDDIFLPTNPPNKTIPIITSDIIPIIENVGLNTIHHVKLFCMFTVFVKRDGYKRTLPVLASHVTLTIFRKTMGGYNVYKYNSGIASGEAENLLDNSIQTFLNLVTEKYGTRFNLRPTISWCPLSIQKDSKLCMIFAFNLYYILLKNPNIRFNDIFRRNLQTSERIQQFMKTFFNKKIE